MLWISIAMAVRPLYVQPEDDGHFRVVDSSGGNVGAWHFAHFTRDRQMVNRLRLHLYFRRTSALVCLGGGALMFGAGTLAINERRRFDGYDGRVDPVIGVYGGIAAAGLLMATIHPLNVLRRRPPWMRVDSHYSQEEALRRIRHRAQVWATPVGLYASF